MKKNTLVVVVVLLFVFSSCGDNEMHIPKPPTYLKLELPNHDYVRYSNDCPYEFDVSKMFNVKDVFNDSVKSCHKEIELGELNGVINFSFIDMVESLSMYVNYSNDKVDEHKIKAVEILDTRIIREKDSVFGTFFELKGDVATHFQFYLTDSTSRFVSGVVYFNSVPNYDSLKPSIDYLRVDLLKIINTFNWKD